MSRLENILVSINVAIMKKYCGLEKKSFHKMLMDWHVFSP
jgi:hypothetical protein